MYKILIVDDEPIILSGIKFLLDWQSLGCEICATARNGKAALESIGALSPDIVICDINMPVLNGLEVLKTASASEGAPVFIMLTNLEDFEMARDAMRYKAVDYLVKTQLEPEILENSLTRAIEECNKRGKLARVRQADSYIEENRAFVVADSLRKVISTKGSAYPPDAVRELAGHGAFNSYFLVRLMMDFSELPTLPSFTGDERKRLFAWEKEVIEKLAGNIFKSFALFDLDGYSQSLVLYCYNYKQPDAAAELTRFYSKVTNTSANITQSHLSLLATDVFSGQDTLHLAISQLHELGEFYAHSSCELAFYSTLPKLSYEPLDIKDISNRLVMELRAQSIPLCQELLDSALAKISAAPHHHAAILAACTELYGAATAVLMPLLADDEASEYWSNTTEVMHIIHRLPTRVLALEWLAMLKGHIVRCLELLTSGKGGIAEKARSYVHENADKRIMLQDVANYVNISPSYLSALFKKEYKTNFIDYINQTKIERAQELIHEGKYRIYEIAYMLAFDNAYYFSKVFKRYTGQTPTEYQRKLRGEKNEND